MPQKGARTEQKVWRATPKHRQPARKVRHVSLKERNAALQHWRTPLSGARSTVQD
jgi:hypothetical protein